MAKESGSHEEKKAGHGQGNWKGKGENKELDFDLTKPQSHHERSNERGEPKESHGARVSAAGNPSSSSGQTTSAYGLQHTISGTSKTPISTLSKASSPSTNLLCGLASTPRSLPANTFGVEDQRHASRSIAASPVMNVKQSLVDTKHLAFTPGAIKWRLSGASSSPYSFSGDIPVPPPLTLPKKTFDAATPLPSHGRNAYSTGVLCSMTIPFLLRKRNPSYLNRSLARLAQGMGVQICSL